MICFAILAHSNEDVLNNQIENIKKYCPNSKIVLYNGGQDSEFGKKVPISICPYSRPLKKGQLGHFLLGVMRWLEEPGESYDYLVNLDSDVMFIRAGFEAALNREMEGFDGMGINMGAQHSKEEVQHWYPGQTMWNEWHRWQPFFQTDYFYGCLNSMQAYRRETVHLMLQGLDTEQLEHLIDNTEVFALEEMLYPTLAARTGARLRSYPHQYAHFVMLGKDLEIVDLLSAKQEPQVFFVHPIERSLNNDARNWITLQDEDIQPSSISQKPKTLTISWGCFQGGVETTLINRLKALNVLGYESHAYFYYGGTGLNGYTNIPYHISNQRHELSEYIRKNQFQVITFINTLYNLDVLNEVSYTGKVLFEFHGEGSQIFEELRRIDQHNTDYEIHGVIVPSRNVERIAHEYLTSRKDLPIYVSYNTLDTKKFSESSINEFCDLYNIPGDWKKKTLIGWVGRLDPNKNWQLMLRIFRKLNDKYGLNAKLVVASDVPNSPHINEFFRKVAKYDILYDVRLLPNVPYEKMPHFYSLLASSGGALLSTSQREGYPYNLLEAQGCYCPVVCTDIQGTKEIVQHDVTGYSYTLDDTTSSAAKYLHKVITDAAARKYVVQNARQQVVTKNDIHTNIERLIEWIEQLVQS